MTPGLKYPHRCRDLLMLSTYDYSNDLHINLHKEIDKPSPPRKVYLAQNPRDSVEYIKQILKDGGF